MKDKLKILNSIEIAKPCTNENFKTNSSETNSGWYCGECKKEVHDLSKLSKKEILKLIKKTDGNFCALIKRDAQGDLITKQATSYSKAILASSAIVASATLLNHPDAIAQDVKNPTEQTPQYNSGELVGEVSIPDKSSSSSSSAESQSTCSSSSAASDVEVGKIAIPTHTRGKVAIKKEEKK